MAFPQVVALFITKLPEVWTPVRKPQHRDLYMREHDYNNQVSSFRAAVERAVAQLKTWRILFTDYRRPLKVNIHPVRGG